MPGREILLKNVSKTYRRNNEEKAALKNISLTIKQGEFIGILGLNGSGKTTLVRLLNGLLKPTAGKVYINGMDTSSFKNLTEIRRLIGMVFQNPDNQIVCPLVEEEIAFGPENLGLNEKEVRNRIEWALGIVGMSDKRNNAPHQLSGGQKQKIALASVLAMLPDYLILDEPTSMLDPFSRREFLDHLRKLNKDDGITVMLISHNSEDFIHANRIIVLDRGSVYLQGSPQEVFAREPELAAIGLEQPGIYRLLSRLEKEGYPLDDDIKTLPELVEKVCQQL